MLLHELTPWMLDQDSRLNIMLYFLSRSLATP
jgi:hypothetical protein